MSCNEIELLKSRSVSAVLNRIYSDYINVDAEEMQETTVIVNEVFTTIVAAMCEEDNFFRRVFKSCRMGGSVGDSLKVHLPDEYDLNVMLHFPDCFTVFPANIPGHIHVKQEANKHLPKFVRSFDDSYVLPEDLLSWFQSLLARALRTFPCINGDYAIDTAYGDFFITGISKIKPGFALTLDIDESEINIDLVPCFEYNCKNLPDNYRKQISQGVCLLIPKTTKREIPFKERYWRLCFQDYEREKLHHKYWLKPAIKLLKVLKQNLGINDSEFCSYHLKSLCLYEMRRANDDFWHTTLNHCFTRLLKSCITHIQAGNVPAVYNENLNLIEHLSASTCANISGRLLRVYNQIMRNVDSRIVAKYLLDDDDLFEFQSDFLPGEQYRHLVWTEHSIDLTEPIIK